jgi:multidrug efflux pump subunit AcrB
LLGRGKRYMVIYGILTAMMETVYLEVPGGFLPDEDQGPMACAFPG